MLRPELDLEFAPAPCNHALVLKLKTRVSQRDFDERGVFKVACEEIGDPGGVQIECPAERHPVSSMARAPKILNRGERPGTENLQVAHCSNCSALIARNRIRS